MAFAPGKVILLGEHAVVYGHPALAGALGGGVHVDAVPFPEGTAESDGRPRLRVPAWDLEVAAGVEPGDGDDTEQGRHQRSPLARAWSAIVAEVARAPGYSAPRASFVARFGVPTGSGLGSSAALSVAAARALAEAAGVALSHEALCAAAMAAETVFHGRPSGIDHAVAARGGFGLFTRAAGLRPLSSPPVPLVVGHTGRERDTRGRVARVAELYAARPREVGATFEAIASLVRAAADALAAADLVTLGSAMDDNQRRLEELEVSCGEIRRMCEIARGEGALGAKLTGGGGGGCVLALAPGREAPLRAAWERAGFRSFATSVGGADTGAADAGAADASAGAGGEARA